MKNFHWATLLEVFAILIFGAYITFVGFTVYKSLHEPTISQLQAEVQSLRVDIEDIKAVQGSEIYDQIRKERERRATP